MHYGSGDTPMVGDRVMDSARGLGTVTGISCGANIGPNTARLSIKWDKGVVEIDYPSAEKFTLVSRGTARKAAQ